jgi:hypothetical protein
MNTYHKTLSDEEVTTVFAKYAWLYRLNTGKSLSNTTISEALKEFTFDDMFMEYINQVSVLWSESESIYWDDNMDKFDVVNYFVPDEKLITEKTWIKVPTENGYEIHLASRSTRKRRWDELLTNLYKKSTTINKQIVKRLQAGLVDNENLKAKDLEIQNQILEFKIRKSIHVKPYEVKIRRSKTVYEYLLPYQYELFDVEETVTRGIPEKIAIVLSSLKDCYFKVDIAGMLQEYNQQISESFKIIEKN